MDCSSQDFPVSVGDCYLIISSSATPFSFCLQSFPASDSFPMSWLFVPVGLSIGASASASVFPMHIQGWFSLGLTHLNSLLPKGLSRVFSSTTVQKHQFFSTQLFMVQLSCVYMTAGKSIALTVWNFVSKVVSLLFNMLPCFVTAFLPRDKCFLIYGCSHCPQWFWSLENKICNCFHFFPFYFLWNNEAGCQGFSFLNVEF